ncbi:MAG TPA: bifunctional demethylmenaquinone methyltransferase/2-methoxy-6-polyprenyl-1,4-benzoquinol methylase UbiE [Vicinamibacterales bacterium]
MATPLVDKSPDRIAGMFDAIAPRYDLLNRVLSAGIDRRWRARAVRSLALTGQETLVDVCAGTADVALEAVGAGAHGAARAVGVDFAGAMLTLGLRKVAARGVSDRVTLVRGDALRLPLATGAADAATVAFGIRNVADTAQGCAELARVLKPGGRLAILEFGVPRVPGLGAVYQWYFSAVLPKMGRLISGHSAAYSYLPASVGSFTPPAEFANMLERAGFVDVRADPLTFGIVYLYSARRL